MPTMKEILGDLFTPEIAKIVGEKNNYIVDNDGNWIPRDKHDAVNKDNKELKRQLGERDTQLADLKDKAAGNESLQKQIDDLTAANKKSTDDYEAKLATQAKEFAIDKAITGAKGKNPKAIKALLDLEKVTLDGENLIGLKEQMEALAKSDAYLFGEEQKKPIGGPGNPGPGEPADPVAAAKALAEERNKGQQAPAGAFDPWARK